jgi:hypothetical protein
MNAGPSDAIASSLLVAFSAPVMLETVSAGCSNNLQAGTVTCTVTLDHNQSAGFNIPVGVGHSRSITATAIASSAAADPAPANNTSSGTVQIRSRPWIGVDCPPSCRNAEPCQTEINGRIFAGQRTFYKLPFFSSKCQVIPLHCYVVMSQDQLPLLHAGNANTKP